MMTSGLRLLIFVWPELGHLRPMLALAASARQMGSHVVFAGIPDSEHTIREPGFPFEPILGDLFPKGGVWGDPPGAARLAWYRSRVQRAETGLKRVADGALKPLLRRIRPGLCLADQFVFFLTLPAYGERIPAAVVHTSFPAGHRAGLPPARTPLVPSDTFWFRWQLRWAQTTSWLRYARDHYGLSIVGLDVSLADWTR